MISSSTVQTILAVDDEAEILDLIKEILNSDRHNLIVTVRPRHALEILRSGTTIDLLLTDMIMPEVRGLELIEEVRALGLKTKVIIMSGYNDQIIEHVNENIHGFLKKPFDCTQLLSMVNKILDSTRIEPLQEDHGDMLVKPRRTRG